MSTFANESLVLYISLLCYSGEHFLRLLVRFWTRFLLNVTGTRLWKFVYFASHIFFLFPPMSAGTARGRIALACLSLAIFMGCSVMSELVFRVNRFWLFLTHWMSSRPLAFFFWMERFRRSRIFKASMDPLCQLSCNSADSEHFHYMVNHSVSVHPHVFIYYFPFPLCLTSVSCVSDASVAVICDVCIW